MNTQVLIYVVTPAEKRGKESAALLVSIHQALQAAPTELHVTHFTVFSGKAAK